jgi:chemotaxis response regulator CheB
MAQQPKLMKQLLLDMLEEESWIEIVGEATQESEIRELVEKTAADLVVVTADKLGRRPAICLELLNEILGTIAVTQHGNYAVCYWASLDIHVDEIESSKHGFLGAVKKAAQMASNGSKVN